MLASLLYHIKQIQDLQVLKEDIILAESFSKLNFFQKNLSAFGCDYSLLKGSEDRKLRIGSAR